MPVIILQILSSLAWANPSPAPLCPPGKPLEAEFISEVVQTEKSVRFDTIRGELCRFKVLITHWQEHVFCPLNDQSLMIREFIERWDDKMGCPKIGDSFSGYVQFDPSSGKIEYDASLDR